MCGFTASNQGFDHGIEEEWKEGIYLHGACVYGDGVIVAVRGDIIVGGLVVEI